MALDFWWMFIPLTSLLLVASLAAILFGLKHKRSNSVGISNTHRLRDSDFYQKALKKRKLFALVAASALVLAFGATTLAASRPVTTTVTNPVKYTRDIVLCLDVSGSMIETDAKIINTFKSLIREFDGERVSMIIFNSIANQVFPLTDDYDYIDEQLDYVLNGFYLDPSKPSLDIVKYTVNESGASLISDGLTACTMSFEFNDPERSRSIILATDNVPNGEPITSLDDAVGFAKNKGVKVYAINPGSVEFETGKPLPEQESELRGVAEKTNGKYFSLDYSDTVPEIVSAIGRDQTTEIKAEPIISKTDDPYIVVWLMIIVSIPTLFLYRRFVA